MKQISILFLLLSICSTLFAKEKIKWLAWELAPEFIVKGHETGNGYADKFLNYFIQNLPEYEHEIIWLNTRRWFLESSKANHCTPHIWKRFKLDSQVYSNAYTLTPPHGILIHKKNRDKFDSKHSIISLQEILKNESLRLAVPIFKYKNEGARYPILYPYFKPYIGKKNLQEITSNSNEISPILLDKNRADYLIAYPTTATAYSRIDKKPNNYLFYPIKEDPYYKTIHVSCNKDALGQEVIQKINAMINDKMHMEFLSYHEEWNEKNPQFRKTYIDYFIKNIDNPNVIQ